ncbi:hypothetical protein I7I48_10848 [Histoplasma ohiense]|nr:hypothetical protein I7I48_10848 [Histoplasma ohiense (nom. inval.)]
MGCCIPVYRCRRRWTREECGGGSGYLLRQRFAGDGVSYRLVQLNKPTRANHSPQTPPCLIWR